MGKNFTINDVKKRQDFLFAALSLCTITAINCTGKSDPMVPFAKAVGIALAVPVEIIPDDTNDTLDFALAFSVYVNGSTHPLIFNEFPKLEEWIKSKS